MKQTTQQINDLLQTDNFSELRNIKARVKENNWENIEYQEMNFQEAYDKLLECIDLILDKSNQGENIDILLTYSDRTTILNYLNSISSYIQNINNSTNHVSAFIQHVQMLFNYVSKTPLFTTVKGYPNYSEKLRQLNYLKDKYGKLIETLRDTDKLYLASKELFEKISSMKGNTEEIDEDMRLISGKIEGIEEDIEKRYEKIKNFNQNVIEYESDIKSKKEDVNSFFGLIEDNEEKINLVISNMNKTIEDNQEKTNTILEKNTELQEEIESILGKSIGTNLYDSFRKKARWMLFQSIFWLFILILSIIYLANIGSDTIDVLQNLITGENANNIGYTFVLRLILVFPAIYIVYFSANEFKNSNKLREEYDFKSAVSVALTHFKDLVQKSSNEKDKKFLVDTITQIFSSPTEKAFGRRVNEKDLSKKAKDIVSDVSDIYGDIKKNISK